MFIYIKNHLILKMQIHILFICGTFYTVKLNPQPHEVGLCPLRFIQRRVGRRD